ncbi:ABC transporter permease [Granulosicoccus antarcticus]|uniref:ABC3 transporter permease C-terminal domain-containing protein n=1 Tax=Granulosicoccus antarcticus IMCC3135 TaxID=1192854 RepID=A0A2Z2NI89_9GAMM|nr:FtsX-like permease family protein [Granulosicoccus antarcticus]ASJ70773.1 hypothetical protein IMCC3135_03300 [Granulosicoccus antarcticus IMCC3135]
MKMPQLARLLRLLWRDLVGSGTLRSLWVFCACLLLGITLISACSSLLGLVEDGLASQQRENFGGDLVVRAREPLPAEQRDWLDENAQVSLQTELRTMMGTQDGDFTVVEVQSVDSQYPLYGQVQLQPEQDLQSAVARSAEGVWGAVYDPVLAVSHGLAVGQRIDVGNIQLELRAEILEQPDRSLSANTRGPPLIIDAEALELTGLLGPTSLVDYDYRIRTEEPASDFRARLRGSFPEADIEIRTLADRSELITQRLDQVASVLLLIGLTTLFIGGLGVANSIAAWIATKRGMLATLQALGAREWQIGFVFIGQVMLLALLSSTAGAIIGSSIAWFASRTLATALPISSDVLGLLWPTALAIAFGVLSAITFALPSLGRTLAADPIVLLRGATEFNARLSAGYRRMTAALVLGTLALMLILLPEPLVGIAFIVVAILLVALLEMVIVALRWGVRRLRQLRVLDGRFTLQIAAANLYRPGNTLRAMLLSLGSALTLLTAAALVIVATLDSLGNTVPERSPSLVFYDVQAAELEAFAETLESLPGHTSHVLAPLVLGRMTHINDVAIASRDNDRQAEEANDEHKLSYRASGVDNTQVDRGAWWPEDYAGPTLVAFEDREADQLGLNVGDRLRFSVMGEVVEAELAAIYSQARFETQFWLEGVFSAGALDPWITRYIGSVHLAKDQDVEAMQMLGAEFPSVVTIRTSLLLANVRAMLGAAALAIGLVAAISLTASLLVMSSVIAATTQRRVYESAIMYALGARHAAIRTSLFIEYLLMALILTVFAFTAGSLIAWGILEYWLKLAQDGLWVTGFSVAFAGSVICLAGGALWLMRSLRVSPALLLQRGG